VIRRIYTVPVMAVLMCSAVFAGEPTKEGGAPPEETRLVPQDLLPATSSPRSLAYLYIPSMPKAWTALSETSLWEIFGEAAWLNAREMELLRFIQAADLRETRFTAQAAGAKPQPSLTSILLKAGLDAKTFRAMFPGPVAVMVRRGDKGDIQWAFVADVGPAPHVQIDDLRNRFWDIAGQYYPNLPLSVDAETGGDAQIKGYKIRNVEITHAFVENLFVVGVGEHVVRSIIDTYHRNQNPAAGATQPGEPPLSQDPAWQKIFASNTPNQAAPVAIVRMDLHAIADKLFEDESAQKGVLATWQRQADLARILDGTLTVVLRPDPAGRGFVETWSLAPDPKNANHLVKCLDKNSLQGTTLAFVPPEALFVSSTQFNYKKFYNGFVGPLKRDVRRTEAERDRLVQIVDFPLSQIHLGPKLQECLDGEQTAAFMVPDRPLRNKEEKRTQWLAVLSLSNFTDTPDVELARYLGDSKIVRQAFQPAADKSQAQPKTPFMIYSLQAGSNPSLFYRAFVWVKSEKPDEKSGHLLLGSHAGVLEKALSIYALKTPNVQQEGGNFAKLLRQPKQDRAPLCVFADLGRLAELGPEQVQELIGNSSSTGISPIFMDLAGAAQRAHVALEPMAIQAFSADEGLTFEVRGPAPLSLAAVINVLGASSGGGAGATAVLPKEEESARKMRTLWVALMLYATRNDAFPERLSDLANYMDMGKDEMKCLVFPGSPKEAEMGKTVTPLDIEQKADYKYKAGRRLSDPGHRYLLHDSTELYGGEFCQFLTISGAVIKVRDPEKISLILNDQPPKDFIEKVEKESLPK
jgi:hypothetical protein